MGITRKTVSGEEETAMQKMTPGENLKRLVNNLAEEPDSKEQLMELRTLLENNKGLWGEYGNSAYMVETMLIHNFTDKSKHASVSQSRSMQDIIIWCIRSLSNSDAFSHP